MVDRLIGSVLEMGMEPEMFDRLIGSVLEMGMVLEMGIMHEIVIEME